MKEVNYKEEVIVEYNKDKQCYEVTTDAKYLPVKAVNMILEQICTQIRAQTVEQLDSGKLLKDNVELVHRMRYYRKLWLIAAFGFLALILGTLLV